MHEEATLLLRRPTLPQAAPTSPAQASAGAYPWASLDAVSSGAAQLVNRLLALLAPGEHTCAHTASQALSALLTPGEGAPARITFAGCRAYAASARLPDMGGCMTALLWAPPEHRAGVLLLDLRLAAGLLHGMLGEHAPAPALVGAPGPRDFGLLTCALISFWGALQRDHGAPALVFSTSRPTAEEVTRHLTSAPLRWELVWNVRINGEEAPVRLLATEPLLAQLEIARPASPVTLSEAHGAIPLRLPVVLGGSTLEDTTLRTIARGDVLLLQRHGLQLDGLTPTPGGAVLCLGARHDSTLARHPVALSRDGARWQLTTLDTHEDQNMQDASALQTPVTVEVVIGHTHITLSQLATLQSGQLLSLEEQVGTTVELRAGSSLLGTGELVTIDGQLGVRVLSVRR